MMLQRVSRFVVWGAVAGALFACQDEGGTPTVQGPLAGLRYVNVVSDTGALDFRIVDIVGDAPAGFGATFRSAGSPAGGPVPVQTSPPYQAVEAGTRRIRVFNSSTDPVIAQQVLLDTTFTFEANRNYTFFLHGFARTAQSPRAAALITVDDAPASLAAGKIAVRVLNLAPSFAGAIPALADTTIRPDVFIRKGSALPAGTPEAVDVPYLGSSQYAVLDTGRHRVSVTPTGTTGPAIFLAHVPPGVTGSNPIVGSLVPGSVLTAVILPRSVAGSAAPQGGSPAARDTDTSAAEASRRVTRSNDTVTVQSGSRSVLTNRPDTVVVDTIVAGNDTSIIVDTLRNRPDSVVGTTGTGASTGVTAGDIVLMSGASQPEYNVWQIVLGVADSLSCNPTDPANTATQCAAENAIATTRFRFRSRIAGTPASPATGTPVYRIYPAAASDFTIPNVMFLIDRRP